MIYRQIYKNWQDAKGEERKDEDGKKDRHTAGLSDAFHLTPKGAGLKTKYDHVSLSNLEESKLLYNCTEATFVTVILVALVLGSNGSELSMEEWDSGLRRFWNGHGVCRMEKQ